MAETDSDALLRSLAALPAERRVVRYRELAVEALKRASICESGNLREWHSSIATGWLALAGELEGGMALNRIARYHQLATEEFERAQECKDAEIKSAHLIAAGCWERLAGELEHLKTH